MLKANGKNIINSILNHKKGNMESVDLNDVRVTGCYFLGTSNQYQNLPTGFPGGGTLIVIPSRTEDDNPETLNVATQMIITVTGRIYLRFFIAWSTPQWSDWVEK